MIGHLRHMAKVRPEGLDRDAARWALDRIAHLENEIAAMLRSHEVLMSLLKERQHKGLDPVANARNQDWD